MKSTTVKDDTISNLKNSAQEIKSELKNSANQVGKKFRNILNSAGDDISQAKDKVTKEIRSNPLRSTLIALGVGVLLGALLRR